MSITTRNHTWALLMCMTFGLITACGDNPATDQLIEGDTGQGSVDEGQEARLQKTRNIFFNIPSPMETASLLKRAGAEYNKNILNDVMKVGDYTISSKQALNLGVYGADLSYASVFDQTQESMFYTSCTKKLADKLGVTVAFNDTVLGRIEKHINDRDSLLSIISETYWTMDAYLKENDRAHLSALMIAGGWVEGLYIASQISRTNDSPELRQRIAEQKLSLKDLVELMETYNSEPTLDGVKGDLKTIQGLFAEIPDMPAAAKVTTENGKTVVGSSAPAATLTDAQLAAIVERVATIRNEYVK